MVLEAERCSAQQFKGLGFGVRGLRFRDTIRWRFVHVLSWFHLDSAGAAEKARERVAEVGDLQMLAERMFLSPNNLKRMSII